MTRGLSSVLGLLACLAISAVYPVSASGSTPGDCFDVKTFVETKFLIEENDAKKISSLFAEKSPAQQEAFEALLRQLPPIGNKRALGILWKNKTIAQATKVLNILLQEDTAQLRERVLTNPRPNETDQMIFAILFNAQWVRSTATILSAAALARKPSALFSDAYRLRRYKLGEQTNVEDFFTTFKIDDYKKLAELAASVKNVPQFLSRLETRESFLKQQAGQTKGYKKLWLTHAANRTRALIVLIKQKQPEFEKDAAVFLVNMSGPRTWILSVLEPGWPAAATKTITTQAKLVLYSLVIGTAATFAIDWGFEQFLTWRRGPFVPAPPPIEQLEKNPIEHIGPSTKEQRDRVQQFINE